MTKHRKFAAKPLVEGGVVMNTHANELKNYLLEIIKEMGKKPHEFSTSEKGSFTRQRKFGFETLMRFILSLGSNSLGHEIGEFFEYNEGFPTTSAFVQQRKKLSYKAFKHLFHEFTKGSNVSPILYQGYRLLAIDGSDLSLPYNPSEDNVVGKNHLSTLHLNAAFDVETKQFVDAIIQKGLKENECSAACELVDGLSEQYPVIIMADRGYESYNLFAHIEERLFDYVIRVKDIESNGMLSGMDLPDTDTFDVTKRIVITRHSTGPAAVNPKKYKYFTKQSRFDFIENSKSPDYEMTIRFVRFKITDDTYESIATSLPADRFSIDELKEIYRRRWGIETGFREVKYILGLRAVHSKQENSILQEIYARLVMYNFSMSITLKTPPKLEHKEKDLKHHLQVNFTQATRICLHFFKFMGLEPPYDIEATIRRFLLPVRPNRQRQRIAVSTTIVSFNYRLA
ncbi:MAG: IS4 family transposase [Bacteroidales bacterium]